MPLIVTEGTRKTAEWSKKSTVYPAMNSRAIILPGKMYS